MRHSDKMKQQITPVIGKTKGGISDIHKNRRICTIILWLTDLHEAKKCGNVALRKVENTDHDPKYKLEQH